MKTEKKKLIYRLENGCRPPEENSGYTQEVFAETLDIGVEHYRKLESGAYGLQPEKSVPVQPKINK